MGDDAVAVLVTFSMGLCFLIYWITLLSSKLESMKKDAEHMKEIATSLSHIIEQAREWRCNLSRMDARLRTLENVDRVSTLPQDTVQDEVAAIRDEWIRLSNPFSRVAESVQGMGRAMSPSDTFDALVEARRGANRAQEEEDKAPEEPPAPKGRVLDLDGEVPS